MWHVYLAKCVDGTLYCGIAKDVAKRIVIHNSGKGAKYTRSRLPVVLVYSICAGTMSEAMKLECRIKQMSRRQKLKLIRST